MQQFVVPQFIDVEDKIIGPVTTRQFLIILVAGIIIFLFYRFGDFSFFIFSLVLFGGLALLFAFVKINGQTFHYFVLNIIQSAKKPSLRIWRKYYDKRELDDLRKQFEAPEKIDVVKKNVKRRHIRDLALLVNTGGFYKPEDEL
ncbi:MAG: PrgI family protein [Patescibacteria group bacterium]|nr:PrgI family protein [Patescibacteria group bacterium]